MSVAIVKNAPLIQPSEDGRHAMMYPPISGAMIRVKLSIEVVAPNTPPLRFGGAFIVRMLVSAGRVMPCPNENITATPISFHQTSTSDSRYIPIELHIRPRISAR